MATLPYKISLLDPEHSRKHYQEAHQRALSNLRAVVGTLPPEQRQAVIDAVDLWDTTRSVCTAVDAVIDTFQSQSEVDNRASEATMTEAVARQVLSDACAAVAVDSFHVIAIRAAAESLGKAIGQRLAAVSLQVAGCPH